MGNGACFSCSSCCQKKDHSDLGKRSTRLTLRDRNRAAEKYLQEIMAHNKTHLVHQSPTQDDFNDQLKEAGSKLVIVDFFATWCGPCKTIAPKIEELAATMTDVIFLKVDVDQVEALASEYNINCMPTFVAIKEGKRLGDISGSSLDKLKTFINEHK